MNTKSNSKKLIILSGCPGAGKSTIAKLYADRHPMTLLLDIDTLWFMMGQWQQSRPASHTQKMKLAYALADAHLQAGYDVIVAQALEKADYYEAFERIAVKHQAKYIEITLLNNEAEAIRRFISRGKKLGYKSGFRPGGIVDTEGREQKVLQMHRASLKAASKRKNMQFIEVVDGAVEQTYWQLMHCITRST